MNLNVYDVIKHLINWKYRIVAVIIIAFFAARFYVGTIQTSSGQVLIKYNDACVSEGQFPDGSKFDQYQVTSPEVLQNAINTLSLNETVETLRRRVDVSPVIPTSIKEMQTAKAKNGEEYIYNPTIFMISYWGMNNQPAYKVRELLETIVFEYFDYYSSLYSDYASISNSLSGINISSFDYIEIAEIMENDASNIITKLGTYKSADESFRSTSTGASFQDLIYEYEHIRDFNIPKIYADIYKGNISKNAKRLSELYSQRADDAKLRQKNFEETAAMTKSKIDSFANANKEVPNAYNYKRESSNNDDLEIIEDIHNDSITKSTTKTTYDLLLENYTNQMISANDARLQSEHYMDISKIFASTPDSDIDVSMLTRDIETSIDNTMKKMLSLYDTLSATINDYNDYSVQKHISLLTGVKCYDNVSVALYEMIAVVITGIGMVVLALTCEILKAYRKKKEEENDADESIGPCSEEV